MKRAILSLLILAAVGCGDDRSMVAPAALAGGWNYTMLLEDGRTAHGVMNLSQDGAQVAGSIDLPRDADVDAVAWRWNVAGSVDGDAVSLRATAHDNCDCDTVPADWTCTATAGQLDCGDFSAAFAGN